MRGETNKKAPSDEEASEEYPDTIINLSYPGKDLPPRL